MPTLKPPYSTQPQATPSNDVQATRAERLPSPHPRVSYFRSLHLDMQIYSPSIQVDKQAGLPTARTRPVFGDQDTIDGKIILDPSYSQNGRLTISLEGAFEYSSTNIDADEEYPRNTTITRHRHVFLSSSATIPLTPRSDSRSTLREALTVRKRPSASSLNSPAQRSCNFSFELPRGSRPGEEVPPTVSSTTPSGDSHKGSSLEEFDVSYRIKAVWEACDGSGNQAILETPVSIQPDADFQSVDGSAAEPQSWLEMGLMPERPIPFTCAVTLPRPHSFSRCTSIPYFVVFATSTRFPSLIKEIAADATIVVSLVRKISISRPRLPQIQTPPVTPPPSDESDGRASPFAIRSKLLKRSLKTPTRSTSQDEFPSKGKSSCVKFPQETFSASRTLVTQVSIGFPKRPRANGALESLPDGLYKGKVQLSKDMLPSVEWLGMSIMYYLDVSVLVGQDALRARVPVRVY